MKKFFLPTLSANSRIALPKTSIVSGSTYLTVSMRKPSKSYRATRYWCDPDEDRPARDARRSVARSALLARHGRVVLDDQLAHVAEVAADEPADVRVVGQLAPAPAEEHVVLQVGRPDGVVR